MIQIHAWVFCAGVLTGLLLAWLWKKLKAAHPTVPPSSSPPNV